MARHEKHPVVSRIHVVPFLHLTERRASKKKLLPELECCTTCSRLNLHVCQRVSGEFRDNSTDGRARTVRGQNQPLWTVQAPRTHIQPEMPTAMPKIPDPDSLPK